MTLEQGVEVSDDEIIDRTERFVAEHRTLGEDDVTLLGAQFDAGLAWVHYPVGDGGLGAGPKSQRLVDERLDRAGLMRSWLRNATAIGMIAPTISVHGTPYQKPYLRRIFTAEDIWCQLFSEPGAGSDVAGLATRAERDGDEWIINGQKTWATRARSSAHGLLLARTDPSRPKHDGLTCLLVDMRAPGVEVRPIKQINGSAHFNEVFFTDVRLADRERLGPEGEGWRVAVTTLMNERVSIGSEPLPRGSGPIRAAVDAHLAAGPDPVRRDRLARLWIAAEVFRLGGIRARQLRANGAAGPEGSILKLMRALVDQDITEFTVNANGADGTLTGGWPPADHRNDPVYRFLESQSETIAGGTAEIMRNILGERILGLPAEGRLDRGPWNEIPRS